MRKESYIKVILVGRERIKLPSFSDGITSYIKTKYTQTHTHKESWNSKAITARFQDTRILYKSQLLLSYTSTINKWSLKLKTQCAKLLQSCLFVTLWAINCQAHLSMGQECWSGLPFLLQGITPESLTSPALAGRFSTTSTTWEVPKTHNTMHINTPWKTERERKK